MPTLPGGQRVRGSVSGTSGLTAFDPIKNTPGTPDRRARRINGTVRNSVAGRTTGTGTYRRAALESPAPLGVRVPTLARRNYIPTLRRLDVE